MLKPRSAKENMEKKRTTLLSGPEIRVQYAKDTCCSKNCIHSLIYGPEVAHHGSVSHYSSSSSINKSITSSYNGTSSSSVIDSFMLCQHMELFDQFIEEVRKPLYLLQAGIDSETEANKQLRYYLVQKFTENRVFDADDNKHNYEYIYQLHSLSRGVVTVCKMAYIIITGVSYQAIEYAQKLVRNNVSAEGILLGKDDQSSSKTKGDNLKEAFEKFHLDYNIYQLNVNHFVDLMKIPDSTTAFMCVTFLAEWFELAGEQEVHILLTTSNNLFVSLIMLFYYLFFSLTLTRYTLTT